MSKEIAHIFKESRNNYGTRKIKKELSKLPEPKHVSRRRIGRLMKGLGLVSNYTVAQYKLHNSTCNEAPIKNELQGQFEQVEPLAVIVINICPCKWHYVCIFVDLFNREIIGRSAGANKTAELVYQALVSIRGNLNDIQM
ncbi:IS3 family transposase [Lysinibacillus sphaericus]|uniref:IS3 family transposase n=1 Tax=Lysinibacillus sphaericus TaxID=1421 RepID=UPI001A9E0CE2|nr:IS3 family transposase [Lysinibacillus sphaericus]QTB29304.1 IS3 family transposase [Lysinibacillus sphaericus]